MSTFHTFAGADLTIDKIFRFSPQERRNPNRYVNLDARGVSPSTFVVKIKCNKFSKTNGR